MQFSFTQIYPEEGASFDFEGSSLRILRERLNALNKHIPHFTKVFEDHEYKLVFIIVATRKLLSVTVKGPTLVKRSRSVEFAVWIPYRNLDFRSRVTYVLSSLSEGIEWTFKKYHTNPSGIADTIRQATDTILSSNPTQHE